ncbi:uncharacterized protein [Mycetomoellerius zeteki]|uniref:uncharacterized protein n=1 Tax=Mycetomoellerius zeteki TaxID=64791 RepID=UPI00084E8334|nr:PREDICTED: uncharacterized protein LOC108728171 [Trachymyrmex zeteki]
MEHPEERYYKLNRFVLLLTGLWPYQSKWSTRVVRAVITTILLSSIIFQLLSLFMSNITANFIIDMIPAFVPVMGSLSQMYARVGHAGKLRDLFEHMWNDWRLRKTNYEIKIMQKHAETSRLLTLYYLPPQKINNFDLLEGQVQHQDRSEVWDELYKVIQYVAVIGYNTWLVLPDVLDIISPINESRPRILPFKAEFFIDQGRYFNLIRSHTCIVIFILSLIFLAVSTLYVTLTQHAYGMFELLGYRAERLFYIVEDTVGYDSIRPKINYGNVVVFVRLHCNIIQFVAMIEFYHTIPFLMDIIGLVLTMSLALTQILTTGGDIDRAFRSISLSIIAVVYLFISNYMAQKVTDMSLNVCEKV